MSRFQVAGLLAARPVAAALLSLLIPGAFPGIAAAQTAVSCAPFCDYRHYYGTYEYTNVQPDLYCRPICGPDGTCVPAKACLRARNVAGGPATVSYYDPALVSPGYVAPRVRTPVVRVRPYRPRR